jgi:hypothetical protein
LRCMCFTVYTDTHAGIRICGHGTTFLYLREKKPIKLRIKPVHVPTGKNSHPNSRPIGHVAKICPLPSLAIRQRTLQASDADEETRIPVLLRVPGAGGNSSSVGPATGVA